MNNEQRTIIQNKPNQSQCPKNAYEANGSFLTKALQGD
jgi:hypothetical protein